MKTSYRCLIIDDERLARIELMRLLKDCPEIEIVGEASGISDAVTKIKNLQPDLIFLDIQLRNETGFDLFDKINYNGKTIFVTAYSEYAIRAFEINAIDYLLKPVNISRLKKSIERLFEHKTENNEFSKQKLSIDDKIFVSTGKMVRFLKISDISLITCELGYSEISTISGDKLIVKKLLKEWEDRLPESHFLHT